MNIHKIFLRAVLMTMILVPGSGFARPQSRSIPSPAGDLIVKINPVGKKGFENRESRIEIRRTNGRLVRQRNFASIDGQHGKGIDHAAWTPDGEFLVFNGSNSGGHQPWNQATYFYSRGENRFHSLDKFIGPVTSDFTLTGPSGLVTTRLNYQTRNDKERITVRLARLHR